MVGVRVIVGVSVTVFVSVGVKVSVWVGTAAVPVSTIMVPARDRAVDTDSTSVRPVLALQAVASHTKPNAKIRDAFIDFNTFLNIVSISADKAILYTSLPRIEPPLLAESTFVIE